jgi:hypothetical protein
MEAYRPTLQALFAKQQTLLTDKQRMAMAFSGPGRLIDFESFKGIIGE